MKNKKLIFLVIIILIFIYVLLNKNLFVFINNKYSATKDAISATQLKYKLPITENIAAKDGATSAPVTIPNQFLLTVPFISQAPFGVWDQVHNDACEEAALVMAKYWVSGHILNAPIADKEILAAVAWEAKNWGQQYELTADRMATLGQKFFVLKNIKIVADPTIDNIKSELSQGHLVLVPVDGRLINNPYYRRPGPIYHILVLKGYNEQEFITNDAGTRRGEGYRYAYQTLFNAMHNWPYPAPDFGINEPKDIQAQQILTGQRAMLVISKN